MMETKEYHITVTRTARYYVQGEKRPGAVTWLALHGYGQLAQYFIRHFAPLEDDIVIAPEGLSRFYTEGAAGRVGATWMTKEDRETEIRDYLQYLDMLFDREIRPLQPSRFVVLGFSQGAATAARWAAHTHAPADHLVLWGGFFPPDMHWDNFREREKPLSSAILAGNRDVYITDENRAEIRAVLRQQAIAAEYTEYEGGHEIVPGELLRLRQKIISSAPGL